MSIETPEEARNNSTRTFKRVRLWLCLGLAGLLGGITAWGAGEAFGTVFLPRKHAEIMYGGGIQQVATPQDQLLADSRNEALSLALMGGIVGGGFGIAGAALRRSIRNAVVATTFGLIAGGLTALILTAFCLFPFNKVRDVDLNDLIPVMMFHLIILSGIGAAAGAAFGIGLGDRRILIRAIVGGLVGGMVGSVVSDFSGTVFFPTAQTHLPISATAISRLFYRVLVGFLTAQGIALAVGDPRHHVEIKT